MKRVEQKLAEWKGIYDQANAAEQQRQAALRMGDVQAVEECGRVAAELNAASERALKAVHEALALVKTPKPPR